MSDFVTCDPKKLPSPAKLEKLADWFDAIEEGEQWESKKVQGDLREWAEYLRSRSVE